MDQGESTNTEERIFKGALHVFAEKGKDGARMQEIADAAGINKAMLHYYFRSKEKLYEAVFKHVFRRFASHELQSTLEQATSYAQLLKTFISAFIDANHNEPAIVKLMANENLAGGTMVGKIISSKEHDSSPPSIFIRKTQEAIERGEIRPVDPQHTMLTILSTCLFFFIWKPSLRIKISSAADDWDAFVEDRKQHIFDMLYHGLALPTPADTPKLNTEATS